MQATQRNQSNDVLRAIETLSQGETNIESAVETAGPGGEAYDRAPNPAAPNEAPEAGSENTKERALALNDALGSTAEKVTALGHKAQQKLGQVVSRVEEAFDEPGPVMQRATRLLKNQRRPLLLIGGFALAFGIGRWLDGVNRRGGSRA